MQEDNWWELKFQGLGLSNNSFLKTQLRNNEQYTILWKTDLIILQGDYVRIYFESFNCAARYCLFMYTMEYVWAAVQYLLS